MSSAWRGVGHCLAAGVVLAVPGAIRAAPGVDRALEARLLATMRVLASDDFAGREPGTEGEAKTLRWIAHSWVDIGLQSGTNDPAHPWFAPVTLVAREPAASNAQFSRRGRPIALAPGDVLVLTSGRRSLIEHAPLFFVGRDAPGGRGIPPRAEIAGRVAVLLDRAPPPPGAEAGAAQVQNSTRQNALLAGGASAVLTVLDGARTLDSVAQRRRRLGYALASEALGGDLEAFVTRDAMAALLGGGAALAQLQAEADRADFTPRALDLTASLEATTRETVIHTQNIIGRLAGRRSKDGGAEAGAVLVLAHWDHFGTCAQAPAEHLICNGAIDNASGVAAMTEIARILAHGPAMDRDVLFIGTTGEELGLLGAEAFAENPPVPLKSIVAAFNLDSVAIAPAGTAQAIVGKGMTGLDAGIAAVARAQHFRLSDSTAPNAYIARQDGWALLHHDVPAVLVSSAYGEITRLEHFFDTDYHRPSDVVKPGIELGGAAQDVAFHVALVRFFADPRQWPAK